MVVCVCVVCLPGVAVSLLPLRCVAPTMTTTTPTAQPKRYGGNHLASSMRFAYAHALSKGKRYVAVSRVMKEGHVFAFDKIMKSARARNLTVCCSLRVLFVTGAPVFGSPCRTVDARARVCVCVRLVCERACVNCACAGVRTSACLCWVRSAPLPFTVACPAPPAG
jgi:hypothetical protein